MVIMIWRVVWNSTVCDGRQADRSVAHRGAACAGSSRVCSRDLPTTVGAHPPRQLLRDGAGHLFGYGRSGVAIRTIYRFETLEGRDSTQQSTRNLQVDAIGCSPVEYGVVNGPCSCP